MRLVTAAPPSGSPGDGPYSAEALTLAQRWSAAVSAKWAPPLLDVLAPGPVRYNRLLESVEGLSPKVLTQTLRRLEGEGLVAGRAVGRFGRQYELTPLGRRLRRHLLELCEWAEELVDPQYAETDAAAAGR